jgi:hypothetical protein
MGRLGDDRDEAQMRQFVVLGTVAALLATSACGASTAASPAAGPTARESSSSPSVTAEELVIVVQDDAGETQTWRLTCDPPGGTHPDPTAACQALAKNGATALAPVPKGTMCSQVYGGPQTAVITGTWHGEPVRSRLSLVNGCETKRWQALTGLLPPAGA